MKRLLILIVLVLAGCGDREPEQTPEDVIKEVHSELPSPTPNEITPQAPNQKLTAPQIDLGLDMAKGLVQRESYLRSLSDM